DARRAGGPRLREAGAAGGHAAGRGLAVGAEAHGGHERLGHPGRPLARLEAVADDQSALRDIGVEVATDLCRRLLDAGAPGLHLYARTRSESVLRIVDALGLAPADRT